MAFVLDCSATMAWVFPDEASEATARLCDSLIDCRAFVPSLWPVEVGSALLNATRRGRVRAEEWPEIFSSIDALPIEIEPVSTERMWGRALDSLIGTACRSTMPPTLNSHIACGCRLPRWIGHSPRPHWPQVSRHPPRRRRGVP